MIGHKHNLKSRRGQVLTEHVFILAAIVCILLVVVSRIGLETSSVFDQLGRAFPRMSNKSRRPAKKHAKRGPSAPTPMADAGTPAPAAGKAPAKKPGARANGGSGGGGLSQSKRKGGTPRDGTVSWGITSTTSTGSGLLGLLVGR